MRDPGLAELLRDLGDEHAALDDLIAARMSRWSRPTPAKGWTVADTVRHLVVAERAATASVRDGRDFLGSPIDGTPKGDTPNSDSVRRDAAVSSHGLLDAWRTCRSSTVEAMSRHDGHERVPWGGRTMTVRALATARLMETWAHGLDCFAALDVAPVDTDRLVHVAWLGHRTLPFAFARRGIDAPAPLEALRLELTCPSGARWTIGPAASDHVIRGSLGAWCRVVTRRVGHRATDLAPEGELAALALDVAQAYLDG